MQILSSVNETLFFFTFAIAIYNFFRFIVPLRIKNTNIILFYVVSVLQLVFRLVEVGCMVINDPNTV